jgi:guanylate kinase
MFGAIGLQSNIIVISAPSGAGKSAIINGLIKKDNETTAYSISYTTRTPRKGEKNGKNYFFIRKSKFKEMINKKMFAEWAKVHNNYYGTSKVLLNKLLHFYKNVLLEIDVKGGIKIKRLYPNTCMIFVMTPNFRTLKERLIIRNKDCLDTINIRLNNAKEELKSLKKYEYLIINRKLSNAINSVRTIIKSLDYKIKNKKNYFF